MSARKFVAALDEHRLAKLVSNVTTSICGINFSLAKPVEGDFWIAASLPIAGGSHINVGLCSDETCSRALAAGMLQMAPNQLDRALIEDTLREILNMVAGQVKTALSLDQALGLPTIVNAADVKKSFALESRRIGLSSGSLALTLMLAPGPSV